MKNYQRTTDMTLWAFEDDGSQDDLITHDMRRLTDAEVAALLAPPAPAVPARISPFQARAALYRAGRLQEVEDYMAAPQTPVLHKLAWAHAQEFERNSPTIAAAAQLLGLTDAALDALFLDGAGIVA